MSSTASGVFTVDAMDFHYAPSNSGISPATLASLCGATESEIFGFGGAAWLIENGKTLPPSCIPDILQPHVGKLNTNLHPELDNYLINYRAAIAIVCFYGFYVENYPIARQNALRFTTDGISGFLNIPIENLLCEIAKVKNRLNCEIYANYIYAHQLVEKKPTPVFSPLSMSD